MAKRGAIYRVPADVLLHALQAVGALPAEAVCYTLAPALVGEVRIKVIADDLPIVPEGGTYPERRAKIGQPLGVE